jgi:hypothetical protein
MIRINKGSVNEVIVTATEKVTLSTPYFLFEFTSDETKLNYYCIATNVSTELVRYDEFYIEDKVSPVAVNGEVNLPVGTYTYKVYQQTSSSNLDPTLTTSVVEEGKSRAVNTTAVSPTVTYESATTTNITYTP